ncbi:MAG TPA: hypothetical protein VGK74_15660 [Symbiobacteriaceae bacterium]|jgi:hypothetical protein
MKTSGFLALQAVWGVVLVVFIVGWLMGKKLPWVADERSAFVGLAIVGFAACTFALLTQVATINWLDPFIILGCLLGAAAAYVIVGMLMGLKLPFVNSYRSAFLMLTGIVAIKFASATLHKLVR